MAASAGSVGIIGGGIAGLVAAAHLARGGVKVNVFEAAAQPGGRARTREHQGFFLNQGPHALYLKGAFLRELNRLGVAVSGKTSEPHAPQALLEGKLHRLPTTAASLATTSVFGVREKIQFATVQKAIIDGATGAGSFAAWLDAQNLRPVVRQAVEALARVTNYANAPEHVSAAATLDQMRLGFKGVMYVDGGWTSLIDGLVAAAEKAGAEVRCGARVERVRLEGRRARIVLADGAEVVADAALIATPPAEAAALAPGVVSLAQHAAEAMPVRANALDLALRRWPDGAVEFVLGVDQPFYFSLHTKAAKLAPEGGAVVHIARYMAHGESVQPDAIEELKALADLAMPGWRDLEVKRQTLRGISVVGAMVRWDRKRAGVVVEDAPGLFLAGDWVGAEGMISDAAAASGAAAAGEIGEWLMSAARVAA